MVGAYRIEHTDQDTALYDGDRCLLSDTQYYPYVALTPAEWALFATAPEMLGELTYLADANDWFGQQRFAEDTDADFLLRVLSTVRTRARAAVAKAQPR